MTVILNGNLLSQEICSLLKERIDKLEEKGIVPCLAVIEVGNDPASKIYLKNKKKKADKIGIKTIDEILPADIEENQLISIIKKFNDRDDIHGILVQLPLPKNLNEQRVIQAIDPQKDVDGFHPINIGKLFLNEKSLLPCTARGIIELLKAYQIELQGKNVVIVGRSKIVGIPLAGLMLRENATVTVVHSYTQNLASITRKADIVISAIGKANFFNEEYLKRGAVVVDVGINQIGDRKIVGDVRFEQVKNHVSAITPVPGGVGPMTTIMLMLQTIEIAERSVKIES